MATTTDHIAARNDADLLARLVATAEQADIPNAQAWAEQNRGRLVSVPITVHGETTSCVTVHAYANAVRNEALAALPEPPGKNLGAVTDDHLAAAVAAVRSDE